MESAYEIVVLPGSTQLAQNANDIVTSLVHLKREIIHQDVKPFRLQYDPGQGLPRTNCANETRQGILIRDVRSFLKEFSFEKNGFAVLNTKTQMTPDDFNDKDRVRDVFYEEIKQLLSQYFADAKHIVIMEHQIRKRHAAFPVSIGGDYERLQPTTVAHIDFTLGSALEASRDVLKINNDDYDRIQCINLWKPLRGPVSDWPLGFCDAQSLDERHDCMPLDVVTRTGYTENCQVYYNPKQRWYYLSKQLASEVLIFRQTDTKLGCSAGVPHTGFYNPNVIQGERPRESIEVRAFIYH